MNETTTMISDYTEIQFPGLGWTFHINPTAFTIGSFEVQWYGIIIAVGLLLAVLYCFPRMKRFGIDSDRASDAVIGGVIGGIIGARLYYVLMKWDEYKQDTFKDTLLAVINTRNGGLAIYGGIIGALIVGLIICKIRKVKVLPMLDITVIGFLIGQGIGRWGNFVNQEAFGTNTDSFLGMTGGRIQGFLMGRIADGATDLVWDKPVHPCFLYESLWCLLGFVLLAFWSKRRKYDGQLLLMYMAWYGAERFVVEGLRTDSLMLGNIRISQALSAIIFIASVIIQIVLFFRYKRDPESFVLYAGTEEAMQLIEETRRKKMGMNEPGMTSADEDDDDEIGILPDEDDDEIGDLPDEEDDDEEAEPEDDENPEEDESEDEEKPEASESEDEEKSEEAESEDEEKSEEAESEDEEKSEEAESEGEEESEDEPEEAENAADEAADDTKEDK